MVDFIKNIKEIKKIRNLTNEELSELSGISLGTLNKLLSGDTNDPRLSTLIPLCNALDCSLDELIYGFDNKSEIEKDIINKFRKLDSRSKTVVTYILNNEYDRAERVTVKPKETLAEKISKTKNLKIKLFDIAVSAGTGSYLSDDSYSTITVEANDLTKKADYAVRVYGNSMSPKYEDGDLLLVSKTTELDEGELGVFLVNNESYFKKLGDRKLISLNPDYDDIDITNVDFSILGKVIGKLKKNS